MANASQGYAALGKQSTATGVVTPSVYVPYYKQSLNTDPHMIEDGPVYGAKFDTFKVNQGNRSHGGSITVMAEPDTAARWFDMLLTKGSTTGANPYTHPYTLSITTDPNWYTLDISFGAYVERWYGVGASKITPVLQDDEWQFEVELSALGSFQGREIASVSTNVLTLKTDYDPTPTTGLVNADLVRILKADGSVVDTTVTSFTSTTVTVASAGTGVANGDMLVLRPATPTLSVKTPFLWGRTEFRFAADASTALSAAQTRLEKGTEFSIEHMFQDANGENSSGAFDPSRLPRTTGKYNFKIKEFFDNADEIKFMNALTKRACVVRMFSETGFELRVTMNHLKFKIVNKPTESKGTIYVEAEAIGQFDTTDSQGMDVKVINAVATI